MRYLSNLSLVFTILFLPSCGNVHYLNGRYTRHSGVSSEEITFTQLPNKFEYYFKSEMGVLNYSTGNWIQNKNQVVLNGFTDTNIKTLKVEKDETVDNTISIDKILIKYSPTEATIKTSVVINNTTVISVSRDTSLAYPEIKTIEVKSYLSYKGLLSSPPKIDTLYSQKIEINNSNHNKIITLKFTVSPEDFVREKLTDTITVKNNHTLLWRKLKLTKSE
jgi:hypothetical protein